MSLNSIKQNIEQILKHYPQHLRPLIKHQLIEIIEFINKEKDAYQKNKEVKRILDLLVAEIANGKFIIRGDDY